MPGRFCCYIVAAQTLPVPSRRMRLRSSWLLQVRARLILADLRRQHVSEPICVLCRFVAPRVRVVARSSVPAPPSCFPARGLSDALHKI